MSIAVIETATTDDDEDDYYSSESTASTDRSAGDVLQRGADAAGTHDTGPTRLRARSSLYTLRKSEASRGNHPRTNDLVSERRFRTDGIFLQDAQLLQWDRATLYVS